MTTRQARKYRKKTKTTKPKTQQQPLEQEEEEAIGGANKNGDGEMRWRSTRKTYVHHLNPAWNIQANEKQLEKHYLTLPLKLE